MFTNSPAKILTTLVIGVAGFCTGILIAIKIPNYVNTKDLEPIKTTITRTTTSPVLAASNTVDTG